MSHDSPWAAPVVVVKVADDFALRPFASEVSFLADAARFRKMDEPDSFIVGHQIAHVLAVRDDQKFSVLVGLLLPAFDRLR